MNVEAAVRVCPVLYNNDDVLCVKSNTYNNTIQLGNIQSFPVHYALPSDCTQSALFSTTITPLINYLFEGCDVSVVTFGQSGTGKSYTLLGPGLNCTLSEIEYGIIPRFLREVFTNVCQNSERNYIIHITWTQICGENVQDLLGTGSVECTSVSEAFELLQTGLSNITPQCAHTLFTITLEQQWVVDNIIQHKISTASFVDLSSSEKTLVIDSNGMTQAIPVDTGLLTLQRCIWALSDPCISMCNINNVVPYNQSALTMLLKDSFGGRAKTVLICCVSPLLSDFMETFYTLQFAMRAQMIKNFVTVNSYTTCEIMYDNTDLFGLQFAANQLFKLVSNAEYLFKNLILNSSLSKSQMEQISQWLTLKQECKDCISESSEPHRSLEIIEEEIENSCSSESEESEVIYEEDTQTTVQHLEELMQNFCVKTDNLVSATNSKCNTLVITKESCNSSSNSEYHLKGARGRRGSIHSVEELIPVVSMDSDCKIVEGTPFEQNETVLKNKPELNYETKRKMLKQIYKEIEGCEKQMNELETMIDMKENLMQQLVKHKNTKSCARDKLKQIYQKLQNDQYVAHSKLLQAKSENNQYMEQKYYTEMCGISQKLHETELIKDFTENSTKKIIDLENSVRNSKKQLEKLKKHKQKEERRKTNFENDLRWHQKRSDHSSNSLKSDTSKCNSNSGTKLDVQASSDHKHLNSKCNNKSYHHISNEDAENLKHEIKELRKTRNFLLEQICKMDPKLHSTKLLSDVDEHKLLQCEEAIEAIDMAIEYKNQLICNCASLSAYNPEREDKVDKILMQQFMKLNINEIRILLKKYFEKVIDLRSISKKLEQQVLQAESQNEDLRCRIQDLSHTLQRVRLETERRILVQQQQHEDKLQLMMHHLVNNKNPENDCFMSHVVESSKQTALAFQVSQRTAKHVDKGSLIARFTRYARHETVPRQLQAAITPPQAKVTRQKNKLIIQQSSK
ncbi:hypothetical protein ILUMI_09539 [Ignelater luminosus]|uniref:Kinesin motor domain-containing protein n=1 Tax=Ignelater luminosus TaxID=2038154 RepID=A0A8K0D3N6_IGNLU|nr:hypothetical protein ILUMI_09539 [Ignelater luminosus]